LLRLDLLQHPETWENKTLPDFLEALAAYNEDIQGYYDNTNANVDVRIFTTNIYLSIHTKTTE
jgi:hypothetical protein